MVPQRSLGEAMLDFVVDTDAVELVDLIAGGWTGVMLRHVAKLHVVVSQTRRRIWGSFEGQLLGLPSMTGTGASATS
jgi:hypothetical protein